STASAGFAPSTPPMTTGFLFDQSADFRLMPHLTELGHDVTAVSREYPAGIPDEEVLAIAVRERRIVITADLDFGELVIQRGLSHAGIILMRLPGATLATKISRLDEVLTRYANHLDQFIVVS